jgi:acetyl esterase/lipase
MCAHPLITAFLTKRLSPLRWKMPSVRSGGCAPPPQSCALTQTELLVGQSAGAHLALMVAYSPDEPGLEGTGGHAGTSSRVHAVVNFYGPADLTAPLVSRRKAVRQFMGRSSQREAPDLYAAASPILYLTSDDPATLIVHGTADDVVPVEQSDRLAAALDEFGIPYVYDRQEGWNHAMDVWGPVNERCLYVMDRFLEKFLEP